MEFENYLAANEVSHNTYKSEEVFGIFSTAKKKITVSGNDPMKVLYIHM